MRIRNAHRSESKNPMPGLCSFDSYLQKSSSLLGKPTCSANSFPIYEKEVSAKAVRARLWHKGPSTCRVDLRERQHEQCQECQEGGGPLVSQLFIHCRFPLAGTQRYKFKGSCVARWALPSHQEGETGLTLNAKQGESRCKAASGEAVGC